MPSGSSKGRIRPHRHIDPVPALRMKMNDRSRTDKRIKVAPDGRGFVGEVMKPDGVLRIEHGIGRIHGRLNGIRSERQFRTLLD